MTLFRTGAMRHPKSLPGVALSMTLALGILSLARCTPPTDVAADGEHCSTVYTVAFSPDGKLLATGEGASSRKWPDRNYALLLDATTGELTHKLKKDSGEVKDLAFSPDGQTLVTGGTICLWDVQSGEEIRNFLPPPNDWAVGADALAFSPDGTTLVTAFGAISYWDTHSGEKLASLDVHDKFRYHSVPDIAISPDGRILATAGDRLDATICLWDFKTRKLLHKITPPNSKGRIRGLESIAFSPDGKILASAAGYENVVRLWDVEKGRALRTLRGHTYNRVICDVAFSPDGKTLASAALDGTVRLWDPKTGTQTKQIDLSQGNTAIDFSPDGKRLAIGGTQAIIIWDIESWKALVTVEREPLPPETDIQPAITAPPPPRK